MNILVSHTATHCITALASPQDTTMRVTTPQHIATHRNTLQHTAQHTAPHCSYTYTRQDAKSHLDCITLQHTATPCELHFNTPQHRSYIYTRQDAKSHFTATHCNTLQHTATHCSTLQHTATFPLHLRIRCPVEATRHKGQEA